MSLILPGNVGSATASTGYPVSNSLRFNDDSTDYLSRTPGSDGNRKTWTFSTWIKRGNIGIGNPINIFGGEDSGSRYSDIMIGTPSGADDTFWFKQDTGSVAELRSTMKLRDTAAWYNLVFTYDSTDSTAADRMKMYVNGVRLTSFVTNTNAGSNVDSYVNTSGDPNYIGIYQGSSKKLDGYLCETVLIDGTALAADSFGEFNSDSGIWVPKDVSGLTFGTNGFYMEYKQSGTGTDASGMGADTSGNTNHFAVSNLTSVDQSTDTCTNNSCVMNPLNMPISNTPTFSEGNLKTVTSSSGSGRFGGTSTFGVTQGKWYIEAKATIGPSLSRNSIGVSYNPAEMARNNSDNTLTNTTYAWGWDSSGGDVYHDSSVVVNYASYTTGDICQIFLDLDNHKLYYGKNGTLQSSTGISLDTGETYFIAQIDRTGGSDVSTFEFNFGSPPFSISSSNTDGEYGNFEYSTTITGDGASKTFKALNSANLAEYG